MDPQEVFRLAREDPNEWIPPRAAAKAIRLAVDAEVAVARAMITDLRQESSAYARGFADARRAALALLREFQADLPHAFADIPAADRQLAVNDLADELGEGLAVMGPPAVDNGPPARQE